MSERAGERGIRPHTPPKWLGEPVILDRVIPSRLNDDICLSAGRRVDDYLAEQYATLRKPRGPRPRTSHEIASRYSRAGFSLRIRRFWSAERSGRARRIRAVSGA